jgi:ribosomal-protein-alanine N-acetyltransferase
MFAIYQTERLFLRLPRAADISYFITLLGDFAVAKNLSRVPHPYTEDDACDFMIRASVGWVGGTEFSFTAVRKADGCFIGMCGLHPARDWQLGYWVGKPYWGQGYATEMAARVTAFGFEEKGAEQLKAKWFHDNPASGRVLAKLGFQPAGLEVTSSLARGFDVPAHLAVLDRETYRARKEAA